MAVFSPRESYAQLPPRVYTAWDYPADGPAAPLSMTPRLRSAAAILEAALTRGSEKRQLGQGGGDALAVLPHLDRIAG